MKVSLLFCSITQIDRPTAIDVVAPAFIGGREFDARPRQAIDESGMVGETHDAIPVAVAQRYFEPGPAGKPEASAGHETRVGLTDRAGQDETAAAAVHDPRRRRRHVRKDRMGPRR